MYLSGYEIDKNFFSDLTLGEIYLSIDYQANIRFIDKYQ